jgi:hypothetical protein
MTELLAQIPARTFAIVGMMALVSLVMWSASWISPAREAAALKADIEARTK